MKKTQTPPPAQLPEQSLTVESLKLKYPPKSCFDFVYQLTKVEKLIECIDHEIRNSHPMKHYEVSLSQHRSVASARKRKLLDYAKARQWT